MRTAVLSSAAQTRVRSLRSDARHRKSRIAHDNAATRQSQQITSDQTRFNEGFVACIEAGEKLRIAPVQFVSRPGHHANAIRLRTVHQFQRDLRLCAELNVIRDLVFFGRAGSFTPVLGQIQLRIKQAAESRIRIRQRDIVDAVFDLSAQLRNILH